MKIANTSLLFLIMILSSCFFDEEQNTTFVNDQTLWGKYKLVYVQGTSNGIYFDSKQQKISGEMFIGRDSVTHQTVVMNGRSLQISNKIQAFSDTAWTLYDGSGRLYQVKIQERGDTLITDFDGAQLNLNITERDIWVKVQNQSAHLTAPEKQTQANSNLIHFGRLLHGF